MRKYILLIVIILAGTYYFNISNDTKTDVKIDGKNVVGFGFHSNGRYAVSELLTKRFIPRLKEAQDNEILNYDETNFSPEKIWKVLMQNEKPGGHGERSTAVGTIDMAVWDIVSKIAKVPLYEYLAKNYGNGKFTNKIFGILISFLDTFFIYITNINFWFY